MGKRVLLLSLGLYLANALQAQFFTGLRGSQYGGVTNVDFNPAIANNRFMIDVNLIGLAAAVNNNYIGIDHKALTHPVLFSSSDFQANYMHERVNGRNKFAYAGAQMQGPLSFMFSFGPKKDRNKNALAFTWHTNFVSNIDNVNETFARVAYYGGGSQANAVTNFLARSLNNANISAKTLAWNDYGITYSRVVIDKGASLLIVGGTLKLIQPITGAYAYVSDLSYKWPEYGTISLFQSKVNYAYAAGIPTSKDYSAQSLKQDLPAYLKDQMAYKNARPTVAADMGVVYQWRPEKKEEDEMDCSGGWITDQRRYKAAVGFSIIDFGAVQLKRGEYSQNFTADIQNWSVGNAKFPDGVQSFNDTIQAHFQFSQSNKKYFTIWLPTRFNLFLDYYFMKDLAVNVSATISPNMAPQRNMVHMVSTFTVTPKYDHLWFGFYLPISYDVMGNFDVGTCLRIGPLIIGTQDITGLFIKKYAYNADIYAALKITIPNHKVRLRHDMRFENKHLNGNSVHSF